MDFSPEILQLVALRRSRGISLESIAEKTKISSYYLKAIEDLDLAKLPGGVYRDSFLKQYASEIDRDIAADLNRRLVTAAQAAAEAQAKAAADSGLARRGKEIVARGAALMFLMGSGDSMHGQSSPAQQSTVKQGDLRYHAIRNFFLKCKCPIVELAADFIVAADKNNLDWRLLPSIAFLESSGGKVAPGRNPLGWGSGAATFKSAADAIHHVAERLARSPIYAGKDTLTKMKIYNPARKDYPTRVQEIMDQLGPTLVAAVQ